MCVSGCPEKMLIISGSNNVVGLVVLVFIFIMLCLGVNNSSIYAQE